MAFLVDEQIQVPSISFDAGSNALDDYEEGTWTPAFVATGTSFSSLTYSTQSGKYTKIGDIVIATFSVISNSTPTGSTGDLQISGLPFAALASGDQVAGFVGFQNNFTAQTDQAEMLLTLEPSSTAMDVRYAEYNGNTGMGGMPSNSIHNASPRILGTIIYKV